MNRTQSTSRILAHLLLASIVVHFICAAFILFAPAVDRVTDNVIVCLIVVWAVWATAFVINFRLIDSGTVASRFEQAPYWVNQPDFKWRAAVHILINWSAPAMTLFAAWMSKPGTVQVTLVWLVMISAPIIWAIFNIRHRRMNRFRNLSVSSAMALLLAFGSAPLLY